LRGFRRGVPVVPPSRRLGGAPDYLRRRGAARGRPLRGDDPDSQRRRAGVAPARRVPHRGREDRRGLALRGAALRTGLRPSDEVSSGAVVILVVYMDNKNNNPGLQALEDELAEQQAHMNAAMARWLGLLADYDRGANDGGTDSFEGWVAWRFGVCY